MTEIMQATCISYLSMPEPETGGNPVPWGWHLVLNLYDCNPKLIQSAAVIRQFVIDLCQVIDMRRFGEPTIVNFGDDPRVAGYSLVQLIETSNICAHFADQSRSVYLDIFSCKQFDPETAASFCIAAFQAQKASGTFISRD
ncbi:MAG: S-adenosylmethionine decarboxylase [Anaerolineaceae bacterium]|nr:S-adenosylmethionine decarboxylase [Anaerolineaceae bacterium]